MKAISIRQPWAWLIVQGHKDIENRTWRHSFRGDVLIHAAKGMTQQEYDETREFVYSIRPTILFPEFDGLKRGGIVGVARVVDCVNRSPSQWFFGPWGFVLDRKKSYPLPFQPCRGALGFYEFGEGINLTTNQHE